MKHMKKYLFLALFPLALVGCETLNDPALRAAASRVGAAALEAAAHELLNELVEEEREEGRK